MVLVKKGGQWEGIENGTECLILLRTGTEGPILLRTGSYSDRSSFSSLFADNFKITLSSFLVMENYENE